MSIFEITRDNLIELKSTGFAAHGLRERTDLQRLLRDRIEIIAPDVLVVSEEFGDWEDSKRRIDLLGIDRDANLVVLELKRTEDGGHMELQALRYAAMVSKMTFEKVVDVFDRYLLDRNLKENARDRLLSFLGWDVADEEKFAQDVRVVLASAEFSRELTSAVLWLNEHDLDIRCVRLRPYTDGQRVFLDVQQVLPLPEASDYFVNLKEKREEERQSRRREQHWSGLWFVNVGMDSPGDAPQDAQGHGYLRHWQHCCAHGYIAAGGGRRYSDALKRLEVGAHILAYQRSLGYLGYGVVKRLATPVDKFQLSDGVSLEEALRAANPNIDRSNEMWEYAVGVEWKKTFPLTQARTFKDVFANQNVVCKLSESQTVSFVCKEFSIPKEFKHIPTSGLL